MRGAPDPPPSSGRLGHPERNDRSGPHGARGRRHRSVRGGRDRRGAAAEDARRVRVPQVRQNLPRGRVRSARHPRARSLRRGAPARAAVVSARPRRATGEAARGRQFDRPHRQPTAEGRPDRRRARRLRARGPDEYHHAACRRVTTLPGHSHARFGPRARRRGGCGPRRACWSSGSSPRRASRSTRTWTCTSRASARAPYAAGFSGWPSSSVSPPMLPVLERALRRGQDRPRLVGAAVFLRTHPAVHHVHRRVHEPARYRALREHARRAPVYRRGRGVDLRRAAGAVDGAVHHARAHRLLQRLLRQLLSRGALRVPRAVVQRPAPRGAHGAARRHPLLLFGLRAVRAAAGRAAAPLLHLARAVHEVAARRADHATSRRRCSR